MTETSHASGNLKQSNKAHKRSHRSKRDAAKSAGGRVNAGSDTSSRVKRRGTSGPSGNNLYGSSREARANASAMIRKKRRDAVLLSRRTGGLSVGDAAGGAPRTVGVVLLSENAQTPQVMDLGSDSDCLKPVVRNFAKEKFRATFLIAGRNNLSVLDVAKAADIICFVLPLHVHDQNEAHKTGQSGLIDTYLTDTVDDIGREFISIVKAQGLPASIGVLQNFESVPKKHQSAVKKHAHNFFEQEFGSGTKMVIDEIFDDVAMMNETEYASADSKNPARVSFLRAIMDTKLKRLGWRSERSYMLGCDSSFVVDGTKNSKNATLKVSGYLRGRPLNAYQLIHIPGKGNFHISKIEAPLDPYCIKKDLQRQQLEENNSESSGKVLITTDPSRWRLLEEEATPDLLSGDQTWPTADDLAEHAFVDMDEDAAEAHLPDIDEMDEDKSFYADLDDVNDPEGSRRNNSKCGVSSEEKKKRRNCEDDQLEYPNEVGTPEDISAKDRFARYRGLKSFRTSPWNPKESLPREYGHIFQMDNPIGMQNQTLEQGEELERKWLASLNTSKRKAKADSDSMTCDDLTEFPPDVVCPGQWLTIYLDNVPINLLDELASSSLPLFLGSVLDEENRISVLNSKVAKASGYQESVRSRDLMTMSCGIWRRPVRPCFSEDNMDSDKHKFERFLHAGRHSVATVYGPITFGTNVPVLFFTEDQNALIAHGTLHSIDPDRVIVKKAILTGHPVRVKKSWAVVRYMFYGPEDVKWFKPIDLWTKYGSMGRILDSIGTHGLFKCSFNKPIKYHDTVCMSLYKRVYPKPVLEFRKLQAEKRASQQNAEVGMELT